MRSGIYSSSLLQFPSNKFSDSSSKPLIIEYNNGIYFGGLNNHKKMHGLGMVFYDDGNILIGNFKFGKIVDEYVFYNNLDQLVFYGSLFHKKLISANYVFSRKNAYIKAQFEKGTIIPNTIVIKNKHITQFNNHNVSDKYISNKNLTPSINPKFIKLTEFLQKIVKNNIIESKSYIISEDDDQRNINIHQIDAHQKYFGALKNSKPEGYGIIFVDQWPVCYGYFQNGQLCGMAKVQENPLLVLDGIFKGSKMNSGWVINHKQKMISFGIYDQQRQKFQLYQEYLLNKANQKYQKIRQFKKKHHIQSLFYQYDYLQQNNLSFFWPQNYLEQIKHDHIVQDIINNFAPSYISEISKVAQLSSNRFQKDLVDLLKEHNCQKNERQKVSKILQTRLRQYDASSSPKDKYRSRSNSRISYSTHKKLSIKIPQKIQTDKKKRLKSQKKLDLDRIYSKYLRR